MKTKDLFIILFNLFFIIHITGFAQLNPKITQVAGKKVKIEMWQGKEVQFIEKELAVKIIPSAKQTEINALLNAVGGKIIYSFLIL